MTAQSTGLSEVRDEPFPVLASAGVEKVAEKVAWRTERACRHLSAVLGTTAEVIVKVLTPEDWEAHATFPLYGMPHVADERTLVVAGEDNEFWRSIVPPVTDLSATQAARMHAVYADAHGELHVGAFFDLLAVHELSHLFHLQADREFPRLWLRELFSNLCLHSYIAAAEPDLLPALETMPAVIVEAGHGRFAHTTLDDFERLYVGVGPLNYGWYQCHLCAAAKQLHDLGGDRLLHRYWHRLGLGGHRSDDELRQDLSAVHPALEHLAAKWPPKPVALGS